jgi:hypothetical protein
VAYRAEQKAVRALLNISPIGERSATLAASRAQINPVLISRSGAYRTADQINVMML